MALEKAISISGYAVLAQNGLTASIESSASDVLYIKVEAVEASKNEGHATVSFSGKRISGTKTYPFSISTDNNAPNFIKQAYEHLKTLPEFAGAADV